MKFRRHTIKGFTYSKVSAILLSGILSLTACDQWNKKIDPPPSTTQTNQPEPQPTPSPILLQRGLYSDFVLKPHEVKNNEQMSLLRDLFEGLVILDPHGNIIPGVAEKWQAIDGKSWIFTLRPDAQWSNGEPLTAHDFVRSWQQLALSETALKQYLIFLNLRNAEAVLSHKLPVEQLGIEALDEHTLQLHLDKPVPYLIKMLAHPALLPQYLTSQNANVANKVIGNGAYRVVKWQENLVELEKNPFYWNKAYTSFQQVNYQKIQPTQPVDELDWIEQPQQKNDQTLYFPQLCTYFYEFNFNDPLLKQKSIRTALVSMISARDIARDEKTMSVNSANFLPQNMQFEQESEWQPTLMEQILQQTGITENNPLTLRMTYENSGIHPMIADRLIRTWSQSDLIRIKAESLPRQQLLEKRAKGDFQLIRSGWCADYNDPSAFLNLLYSKSPDNKMAFHDKNVDSLLEQTLSNDISAQERSTLYQEITSLVQRDKVVLPLFQYMKPIYVHDSLAGYDVKNPTEVIYSKDLYRIAAKSADTTQ
ncbi:MAG TPA: peptide ABC transporter substrate-binding protein [Pasteurellaceae bacterium]|nr:peptide ABC transporter substrate-binding protein [Pasteurellaceae bacterium]